MSETKVIENLKARIVDELEELEEEDTWCPKCVEATYYMVKTWKYLAEIEKMESLPPPSTR